ncbi:DUF6082 family protein [Nonomuraea fuscirosea]|uniref:DUF6082 family protein n=1 Tax=Nonomuraea fuscirosea TaxID=1291556 RepID=UPI0037B59159
MKRGSSAILAKGLLWGALGSITLLLVFLSPLVLTVLERLEGVEWADLSNVGETYGAASAVLSGLALLAVAISLVVQAGQARMARVQYVREFHRQLLSMALDDPYVYGPVLGMVPEKSEIAYRQTLYATLWINYARLGHSSGLLTNAALRAEIFPRFFRGEVGRAWYRRAEPFMTAAPGDRQGRAFVRILQSEYLKAERSGPPAVLRSSPQREPVLHPSRNLRTPALIGLTGSAVVIAILATRKRTTPSAKGKAAWKNR